MTTFSQLALKIIKEQELIIGPVAWEEAKKVTGLHVVDQKKGEVTMDAGEKQVLEKLVAQYERLFGRASVEVCRDAVRALLVDVPKESIPEVLK